MSNLARTAFFMALLMLISKFIGFVREMVMAGFYGTSYVTDAYVMAVAIPMILFGGIFGAVAIAYMPVYSKVVVEQGEETGNLFTSEIINLLIILSIISSILGIVFSDQITSIFASGFIGETAELCSFYVKITFSYVLFSSITGILEAYLQYKGLFLPQVIAGYLLSGTTIVIIIISAFTSHYFLVLGLLIGYIGRFIIIALITKRIGFRYTPSFNTANAINKILKLAVPVFIGSGMLQISAFVDKTLASGLNEGSVSALNYGLLLVNVITNLTIGILTTIIYPRLAQSNAEKDHSRFGGIISTGVTLIIMLAMPCTLGAMLYSNQIIQVVFERGAFDTTATTMTASAFFYYAIGLLFISMNDIITRAYYSMQDMKTPILCSGVGVIIDIILNLILVRFMAHNGLALATSIASACSTGLLYASFKKRNKEIIIIESKHKIVKIILASIIAVGMSGIAYYWVILPLKGYIYVRLIQLGLAVSIAVISYYIILRIMKIEEIKLIWQIIKR